jgi:hypothetical protein
MPAVDTPLVNGVYWAYADIIARAGASQFYGFASINYTHKLARQYVRGTHREPLGMTSGQYEATGDFELYLPQADAFRSFLITEGGGLLGYAQVSFTFTVSYAAAPEGAPLPTLTDVLQGCRITEDEASQSEGLDALKRKFSFMAQRLIPNGNPMVLPPLTGLGVVG